MAKQYNGYRLPKSWTGPKENKAAPAPAENKAEANEAQDLSSLTVAELAERAEAEGVEVEGTGKDGRVLKSDYIEALG